MIYISKRIWNAWLMAFKWEENRSLSEWNHYCFWKIKCISIFHLIFESYVFIPIPWIGVNISYSKQTTLVLVCHCFTKYSRYSDKMPDKKQLLVNCVSQIIIDIIETDKLLQPNRKVRAHFPIIFPVLNSQIHVQKTFFAQNSTDCHSMN